MPEPDPAQNPPANPPPNPSPAKSALAVAGPWIAAVVAGGLFVLIIGSVFVGWPMEWDKALLHQLSDTPTARGLITFLIAVSTVGIALTLTIFIVSTDDPNPKDRFGLGKEVLTSLIGVLGTIVGFYFGASNDAAHRTVPLTIAKIIADPSAVKKAGATTVNATITGGELPYQYSVVLHQADATVQFVAAQGTLQEGTLQSKVTLPDSLDSQKPVEVNLEVSDKSNTVIRGTVKLMITP